MNPILFIAAALGMLSTVLLDFGRYRTWAKAERRLYGWFIGAAGVLFIIIVLGIEPSIPTDWMSDVLTKPLKNLVYRFIHHSM